MRMFVAMTSDTERSVLFHVIRCITIRVGDKPYPKDFFPLEQP